MSAPDLTQAEQLARLKAARDEAKAKLDASNTVEHREAYKAAWNAFEAAYAAAPESIAPKPKRGTFACRAGQRQAAERRAMTAENMRRRWR